MESKTSNRRGLPKFDSTSWLSFGMLFSLVLLGDNVWSLISGWDQPFFPYQLGKFLGMAVGLGLAVHCIDMIVYYRKHGRLEYQKDRE